MGSLSEHQRLQVVDKYEIPSNASCEYYEEVIEESEEEGMFSNTQFNKYVDEDELKAAYEAELKRKAQAAQEDLEEQVEADADDEVSALDLLTQIDDDVDEVLDDVVEDFESAIPNADSDFIENVEELQSAITNADSDDIDDVEDF